MTPERNQSEWSEDDIDTAVTLWHEHFARHYGVGKGPLGLKRQVCRIIADALDRTPGSVIMRLYDRGPTFAHKVRVVAAPKLVDVVVERQRRLDARNRLPLTGLIFGDPPPGYSALDKARGLNP